MGSFVDRIDGYSKIFMILIISIYFNFLFLKLIFKKLNINFSRFFSIYI